ncbi:MAG: hypothetical protein PHY31_09465 [Smithellaceae bacterium]|nr:hypothetical protein [Smithellaceae bacterium]
MVKEEKAQGASARPIRDAATVILCREREHSPFEIFMMRRHSNQAFMGGAIVFPGGRLDERDCDPELFACGGMTPKQAKELLQEPDLPCEKALGLFYAAIRETFEEAGVLLARGSDGKTIDLSGERRERFDAYRGELHDNKLDCRELAAKEGLTFAPEQLIPYAHWITPEIESHRFDTRFLLAKLPPGQAPVHDSVELTESFWISPREALAKHRKMEIMLMPPTLRTMEELALFPAAAELFQAAANRTIPTILPEAFIMEDGFGVKLPNDPEYTIARYKQPSRRGEVSRIVLRKGGTWETMGY